MPNIERSQSVSVREYPHVLVSGGAAAQVAQATSVNVERSTEAKSGEDRRKTASRGLLRLRGEALKKEAGKILRTHDVPGAASVTCCGTKARHGASVTLRRNLATGRASYGGLFRCGNVWACPDCGKRIARSRAEEANIALAAARKAGLTVALVTLTFQHTAKMPLAASVDALKRAKMRFAERAGYRRLPLVGTITATEATIGERAGWHPHVHMLVFLEGGEAAGLKALRALAPVWRDCLKSVGLSGGRAAFHVANGSAAGDYIAKTWAAAEELTLGNVKSGKAGGRSPEQLLADAADGCGQSRQLWAEYARAFHGKRQLVWSRGLKARFNVSEVTDAEAAQAADAADAQTVVLRTFSPAEWAIARERKIAILRAAERGASIRFAWMGPTDAERWRRFNGDIWER
jgi:hypothetical protein